MYDIILNIALFAYILTGIAIYRATAVFANKEATLFQQASLFVVVVSLWLPLGILLLLGRK